MVYNNKIIQNTFYWLIFFLVIFIPVMIYNDSKFAFQVSFGVVFPCILPVYLNYYLLDKYLKRKMYLSYIIWFLILISVSGVLAQYFIYVIVPVEEGNTFGTFANPLVVIIVTSGIRFYVRGSKMQIQLYEAQAKQYKAELDLLKYQVNPHFFFNTLNNLFAMARKQNDPATAEGIAKLSHIMRYILYESNVEKIEISKEIEQIENLIELQKLRFSRDDDINISFNIHGNVRQQKIVPMLLIPFVENAFKHGISLINESPIEMNLNVNDTTLSFSVKNKVNTSKKMNDEQNSGIGLANVRRRLELLYRNSHQLKIINEKNKFEIYLTIELQ